MHGGTRQPADGGRRQVRVHTRRLLVAAALGLVGLRRAVVEVAGPSMGPTLVPGDRLLTVPARRRWLRAGQVVVLTDPGDPAHLVVKRVRRVSGDRVEVVGDDPARSTDSRRWGTVPASSIRRIALTRWPDIGARLTRRP
jgi:nickel-type superoxide dismutase maturation protease